MGHVIGAMMWDVEHEHLRRWAVAGAAVAVVSMTACSGEDEAAVGVKTQGDPAVAATSETADPENEGPAPTSSLPSSDEAPTPDVADTTTDSAAAATGSGVAVYEGDQYDFDVVACGWASGDADADRPLGPTPDDRRLFQLVGVGRDVAVTVQAAAPNGTWLYVMAADSGPDEVVVGREGDRTGADATGDLIDRDGDRLTSSGPIMLSDRVDDSPAETVTLDVSCA